MKHENRAFHELLDVMRERNITISQLTREAGINVTGFYRYKNGEASPTLQMLKRMEDYLGVQLTVEK